MKSPLFLSLVAALAATANLSAQNLLIDFNSTSQGGGPTAELGYESYDAAHEVTADFVAREYTALGATITLSPAWPDTPFEAATQQMIDRGANNDANWTGSQLDLITDFIGIDTRTANGGLGDFDGVVGTPTRMTLTLDGVPAGEYQWVSYHHDTENVHTPFQIEISTDGGTNFTEPTEHKMSSSSGGGAPPNPALEFGPSPQDLTSTVTKTITANGNDEIIVRFTPLSNTGVHNQIFGINGFELISTVDADGDELPDSYEQLIIDADPDDAIEEIEDVLPGDDFDSDGSNNEDELANNTDPTDNDSDGDDLLDGVETNDGDFASETATGSDPNDSDSDDDGLNDGEEVNGDGGFVTDPNDPDTDGDGFDDSLELDQGSDPTDENSTPELGLTILFIGGQAEATQGADAAVMTFLEERYGAQNVTYQQAGATNAGDENAYSALVISSTPGSGDMRNKFHNSITPTLNWEEATADSGGGEYGMSSVQMTKSQDMTMMELAEHPITIGLPAMIEFNTGGETTNTTELFDGLTAVATAANGTGSAGPGNGADITGNPTVFVAEAGDAVNPGAGITDNVAPARRVMFPMTDNTFNNLTDDGKTLFGQSIDWILGISGEIEPIKITDVSIDFSNPAAPEVTLTWTSKVGKQYTVFANNELNDLNQWGDLDDGILGEKGTTSETFFLPPGEPKFFFKVQENQ